MNTFRQALDKVLTQCQGDPDIALMALEMFLRDAERARSNGQDLLLESNFVLALQLVASQAPDRVRTSAECEEILRNVDAMLTWIEGLKGPDSLSIHGKNLSTSEPVLITIKCPRVDFPLYGIEVSNADALEVTIAEFHHHLQSGESIERNEFRIDAFDSDKSVLTHRGRPIQFDTSTARKWLGSMN